MSDRFAEYGFHFVVPGIIGVWGMNSDTFRHWYWFGIVWVALVVAPPFMAWRSSSEAWTWRKRRDWLLEIIGFSICYAMGSWMVLLALEKWYPIVS